MGPYPTIRNKIRNFTPIDQLETKKIYRPAIPANRSESAKQIPPYRQGAGWMARTSINAENGEHVF